MKNEVRRNIFTFPDSKRFWTIVIYGLIATIVFTAIYGYCNKAASLSSKHYAAYFEWELSIPLIPWMIFPYISLNLLFVFMPFVMKTSQSIKGFCLSLVWGAVIAGFFFYFFPGKLGFERAVAEGYESLFTFMFSIDHPHNLFPSLHVTYSTLSILAMKEQTRSKYFHHFLHFWLFLITISVILVHQHHLLDIVTGAALAALLYPAVYLRYAQKSSLPE